MRTYDTVLRELLYLPDALRDASHMKGNEHEMMSNSTLW
jgi:hypothetical protein